MLEEKANKWSNVPPPAIVVDDWASAADTSSVDKSISSLQDSNAVLVGIAARQQREIKSLCNELYIQQDRQNYLNLHLGGVSEVQGKTPKEEAVQFFKEILQMSDITVKDFVKAYSEKDKEGRVQKFQVKAPGVMFVCLASETIRDQAIGKARGLGGKRHEVFKHKFFVSSVECEAVRATKERYKKKIGELIKSNKENEKQVFFQVHGTEFLINGQLQQDIIWPPSYDVINTAMLNEKEELDKIHLYNSGCPLERDGNSFHGYTVYTLSLDIVRLSYIKAVSLKPQASHMMMAYKVGNQQGSCDNGNTKLATNCFVDSTHKRKKNIALFVARESSGQKLGAKQFKYILQVAEELLVFMQNVGTHSMDEVIQTSQSPVLRLPGDSPASSQGTP